ncbi:MAG: dienelactone hydrolase family protein [Gammaproteobacteria bacterium]
MFRILSITVLLYSLLWLVGCEQQSSAPQETANDEEYIERMSAEHADDQPLATPAAETGPDSTVLSVDVVYLESEEETLRGYLVYPEWAHGALPGILVFHEWWGLNDNVRAMADRLAGRGYVVLALDFYQGQSANTPDQARELMRTAMAKPARTARNITAAFKFLRDQTQAVGIATLGWCLGGSLSLSAALQLQEQVDAVVVYYGHIGAVSQVELANLQAPLLGFFGGQDQAIPAAHVEKFHTALERLGKPAEIHIYPDAEHAFANPSGTRYRAKDAEDAWQKTLAFLEQHLGVDEDVQLLP